MSVRTEPADILALVLAGGDERIAIRADTGRNRYHLDPLRYQRLFSRGSCTAGTLNPDTERALLARGDRLLRGDIAALVREREDRLRRLLNYPGEDQFDVIFAPSGSDLAYIPVLITSILHPGAPITSFVTCPEELGSGSNIACAGRFFMRRTQFGREVDPHGPLNKDLEIEVVSYPARSESGHIIDHRKQLEEAIYAHRHRPRIGNLVIGSKSGIEDNLTLIPFTDEDVLWSVDLCQFRNNRRLVNVLLDMGCLVMITGSKFYQAPPFCGAMLVPKSLSRRLQEARFDPPVIAGFDQIFSAYDFSSGLENVRSHFPAFENRGLAARWECALTEMELFERVPEDTARGVIADWNRFVMGLLEEDEAFQPMPHQERTNQSIISFKVRSGDRFLNAEVLGTLWGRLCSSDVTGLAGHDRVFFGQPVAYPEGAFIRLALGAFNIRTLLEVPPERRFDIDRALVRLIAQAAASL